MSRFNQTQANSRFGQNKNYPYAPWFMVALLLLFFAGAYVYFIEERSDEPKANTGPNAVKVVPFLTLSAQLDDAIFTQQLRRAVVAGLNKNTDIQATHADPSTGNADSDSRMSVFKVQQYRAYRLEGHVRRFESHVRVTIELYEPDKTTAFKQHYDRKLTDMGSVWTELSNDIIRTITNRIQPQNTIVLNDHPTTSVKAYEAYLYAKSIDSGEVENELSMTRQQALLEQAVELDPEFARVTPVMENPNYPPWVVGEAGSNLGPKRYEGSSLPVTKAFLSWMQKRDKGDAFAIATSQAKKEGYDDFSEGSEGREKRNDLAEKLKES